MVIADRVSNEIFPCVSYEPVPALSVVSYGAGIARAAASRVLVRGKSVMSNLLRDHRSTCGRASA